MLWVWTIESILLGLTAYAILPSRAVFLPQLIIVFCTGALELFCMAWPLESEQHNVTLAHLSVLTGLLLSVSNTLNVTSIESVTTFSMLAVLQITALGMAFSTKDKSTPLWFHMGTCINLIVPMAMDYSIGHQFGIWGALGLSIVVLAVGLLPWVTARIGILIVFSVGLIVALQTWWSIVPGIVVLVALFTLTQTWVQPQDTLEVKSNLDLSVFRTKRL